MQLPTFLQRRRARNKAKDALGRASLLLAMNRDRFSPELIAELQGAIGRISEARKHGASASAIYKILDWEEAVIQKAEQQAPRRRNQTVTSIVETAVVALGVAMAFRAYFFQPFKIPTGSMQPTLYGIHSEAAEKPALMDAPGVKWLKWIVTGREWCDATFSRSGTLVIDTNGDPGYIRLTVSGESFQVPRDAYDRGEVAVRHSGEFLSMADSGIASRVESGQFVQAGDCLWRGYVISGDQVFVNRLLWNFGVPKRDEVVVFATGARVLSTDCAEPVLGEADPRFEPSKKVPFFGLPLYVNDRTVRSEIPVRKIQEVLPGGQVRERYVRDFSSPFLYTHRLPSGEHYIKRLVGLPGETISLDAPFLVANGSAVKGLPGMDRMSGKGKSDTGPEYAGYLTTDDPDIGANQTSVSLLATPEDTLNTGDGYLPMGDNSPNSYDGRYWGPVPRRQMLGPACCVYWPISVRWGRIF